MKMADIFRYPWSQGHVGGPAGPTPSANSRGKGQKGGPGPGLPSSSSGGPQVVAPLLSCDQPHPQASQLLAPFELPLLPTPGCFQATGVTG